MGDPGPKGIRGGFREGPPWSLGGLSMNLLLLEGCLCEGARVGSPGGALRLVSRLGGTDSRSVTVEELKDGPVVSKGLGFSKLPVLLHTQLAYVSENLYSTRMTSQLSRTCLHLLVK